METVLTFLALPWIIISILLPYMLIVLVVGILYWGLGIGVIEKPFGQDDTEWTFTLALGWPVTLPIIGIILLVKKIICRRNKCQNS